jgi:hypothetical protein
MALKKPHVLCLYLSLPEEMAQDTLDSILTQTVPVTELLFVLETPKKGWLPERISTATNHALEKVNLEDYDYILRVSSDQILPPRFLESALNDGFDVSGFGSAQLVRVAPFIECMGGRLNLVSDDNYIHHCFMQHGYSKGMPSLPAVAKRRSGESHEYDYHFKNGGVCYQLGYEPLHVIAKTKWGLSGLLYLLGYFVALLTRQPLVDSAEFIRYKQFQRLTRI